MPVPANNQIKAIVDRIEHLEDDKDIISNDIKEIYAEAKSNGFDVKALRTIIRLRKQDAAERAEQEAILEVYMSAMGMLADTPLGRAAAQRELSPYQQGQAAAKRNEAPVPSYSAKSKDYKEFMDGFNAVQEKIVKTGIAKLEKAPKPAKSVKAKGKRGRPKGSGKKAASAPEKAPERVLITKAEKDAKMAARTPKADASPPRPTVEPITRATLAAKKAEARETADSYFSKSETKGNA